MKIPPAHRFPPTCSSPQSLVELLAQGLAENERLTRLVDELRQENLALRQELVALKQEIAALRQENLALQERLNRNSKNSNQPPSQDSPFEPPQKQADSAGQEPKGSARPAAKKSRPYHKGVRQQLLPPDTVIPCLPGPCSCGCLECVDVRERRVHQWIELPERLFEVVHFQVREGRCRQCGKKLKGHVPRDCASGYGPRLTAFIATLNVGMTVSWRKIADCLRQVFGLPISLGAVGKCLKRAAAAIEAHYEAIGRAVRASPVNHVDETTWRQHGPPGKVLLWLWVLVNREAAFFRLAQSRKAEEFEALRGDWVGTLVSDDMAVYRKWEHKRQSCLAHLIRTARGLAGSGDVKVSSCGKWGLKELQRLVGMSPEKTSGWELRAFLARFCRYVALYRGLAGKAGAFVRRLDEEFPELVSFLLLDGVEPTNNRAERSLRHGVVLRKISIGTSSEWGRRWIERALSLYQTCRLQKRSFFEVMREALCAAWGKLAPDLGWIEAIAAQYANHADTPEPTPTP